MSSSVNIEFIEQHIDARDNPHGVTREYVGLGFVENFKVATDQEAFEGVEPNLFITPKQLKRTFDGILTRLGYMDSLGHPILKRG